MKLRRQGEITYQVKPNSSPQCGIKRSSELSVPITRTHYTLTRMLDRLRLSISSEEAERVFFGWGILLNDMRADAGIREGSIDPFDFAPALTSHSGFL